MKALALHTTGSKAARPVLCLDPYEGSDPLGVPTCGHTDKEQALELFPATSQK
jgi:hypothetical protein